MSSPALTWAFRLAGTPLLILLLAITGRRWWAYPQSRLPADCVFFTPAALILPPAPRPRRPDPAILTLTWRLLTPQHRTHLIRSWPSARAILGALTGPTRCQLDHMPHKPAPDPASGAREEHDDH